MENLKSEPHTLAPFQIANTYRDFVSIHFTFHSAVFPITGKRARQEDCDYASAQTLLKTPCLYVSPQNQVWRILFECIGIATARGIGIMTWRRRWLLQVFDLFQHIRLKPVRLSAMSRQYMEQGRLTWLIAAHRVTKNSTTCQVVHCCSNISFFC
jgi:hypothetical protein